MLDAYVRVSRVGERGGDSFISPDVQRTQIKNWADENGVTIAAWHEDLDVSGRTMARPAFNAIMRRIEYGETGGVAVAKMDRFGRTMEGALNAIRKIEEAGGIFISVQDGVEASTTVGKLYQRIRLMLAEFEGDTASDGWRVARGSAIDRGIHIGPEPFGYRRNHDRRLIPDSSAELVKLAFKLRFEGRILREIADVLNQSAPPRRGAKWIPQTVAGMLKNPTYLGQVRHGEFVLEGAHEPLVTPVVFAAVASSSKAAPSASRYLLTGLLRCAGCRHAMSYRNFNGRTYYRCARSYASGDCGAPVTIDAREIERYVGAAFVAHLANLPKTNGLTGAERGVEITRTRLAAFRDDDDVRMALGRQGWLEGLEARAEALREAEQHYRAACNAKTGLDVPVVLRSWPKLDVPAKRRYLQMAVDAVFIRAGEETVNRTRICWRSEMPDDMPRRGNSVYRTKSFRW